MLSFPLSIISLGLQRSGQERSLFFPYTCVRFVVTSVAPRDRSVAVLMEVPCLAGQLRFSFVAGIKTFFKFW